MSHSRSAPAASMPSPTPSSSAAQMTPSPKAAGLSSLARATNLAKERLQQCLMPPPAPRASPAVSAKKRPVPRAAEVLDEDEWTLRLEQIVERDYFPDLTRLKARLDWLEATRRCARAEPNPISPRARYYWGSAAGTHGGLG